MVSLDGIFLDEILSYDSVTGRIVWIGSERPSRNGKVAGTQNKNGYLYLKVAGKSRRAHRIAWALHYGEFPNGLIDHANGIRSDNRIENLRMADATQNRANSAIRADSTSGIKGVSWNKKASLWRAQIGKDRKRYFLGEFSDINDAKEAYTRASIELFGVFSENSR